MDEAGFQKNYTDKYDWVATLQG